MDKSSEKAHIINQYILVSYRLSCLLILLLAREPLECWVIVLVYTTISMWTLDLVHQTYNSHSM